MADGTDLTDLNREVERLKREVDDLRGAIGHTIAFAANIAAILVRTDEAGKAEAETQLFSELDQVIELFGGLRREALDGRCYTSRSKAEVIA